MKKLLLFSALFTLIYMFLPKAEYREWLPGPFDNNRNIKNNIVTINQSSDDAGIYKYYQDDYSISYFTPNNKPIEIPKIKLNNFNTINNDI